MERVVIRPRRRTMLVFAFLMLAVAGLLGWALIVNLGDPGESSVRSNPLFWIATAFATGVGALLLWQVVRRTPLLVLDAHGITIAQVGVTLPWDDVLELAFVERTAYGQRHPFLAIRPRDEYAVAARLHLLKRAWVTLNTRSWLNEPLVVPLHALPMSRHELRDLLARYFDGPIRLTRRRG